MRIPTRGHAYVCRRCLAATRPSRHHWDAAYSTKTTGSSNTKVQDKAKSELADTTPSSNDAEDLSVQGAMSRRLEEATEEALLSGGTAGRRAVEDAGFSDELKEKLLDKINDAKFRKQFAGAFAEANLTPAAGEATRHIAGSQAWTGEEDTADAVLRMLDDARKPLKPELRGKFKLPPVDMRIKKKPILSPGQRAASARDKVSVYTGLGVKDKEGLSDKEKEEMRKAFQERFAPGARSLPNTITGLAALANERIEDAIKRGQFKDLPRGEVKKDPNAGNPFIDTTEYIMNKMIQRQELVPPWIEKQQELVRAANSFRQRLRNDWKRHAARMIASTGGSLLDQMKRAEEHAASEVVHNPRRRAVDQISVSTNSTDDPVMVKMRQRAVELAEAMESDEAQSERGPLPPPFRDEAWVKAELAYMTLSIDNLNALTRSYNLMAPDLAKKPYFSLERELASCFADVAPQVAGEIKDRAAGRRTTAGLSGALVLEKKGEGILGHWGSDRVKIHLEAEGKAYGLKEWWRDLWKKD